MPLNKLAQSLTGTCRHCGQKTGILQRIHPECQQTHQAGIQEMTQLATQAAQRPTPSTRPPSGRPWGPSPSAPAPPGQDIDRALEEGFR